MAEVLGELEIRIRAKLDELDRDLDKAKGKAGAAGEDLGRLTGKGIDDGVGSELSKIDVSSKLKAKLGKGLAIAGAAAGAAGGIAAIAGFTNALDREASNAKFAAGMGLSPEYAAKAGKIAGDLYADNFGQSFDQVNAAIQAVTKGGLIDLEAPREEIEKITAQALTMADVFEIDLAGAMATVGNMLLNNLVPNAQAGLDLLAAGLQRVAPNLRQDILDAINEYGVFFNQLGIDGPRAMGALVAASAGGTIAIDKTGDAIKELTIRAVDGSKSSSEAFKTLGLDAERMARMITNGGGEARDAFNLILDSILNLEDPVEQVRVGVALMGTPFEDLGQNAIPVLKGLNNGMQMVEGSAQKMVDTVGGTGAAKLETFKRSMEENVTKVMSSAIGVIEKLPGPAQTALTTMAGFMPVLAPLTPLFAALIPLITGTGVAAAGATVSLGTMAAALWAVIAPVLAVTAVLGVIIAVGVLVVKNWDWIKEKAGEVWGWIRERIDGFLEFFQELPGRIGRAAAGMWDGIKDAFRAAINWIIGKWNGLSFKLPSFGGWSIAGRTIIPGWEGPTLAMPRIDTLDSGGIATGPVLAALSMNRKPEAIIPLDQLDDMLGEGSARAWERPVIINIDPRIGPLVNVLRDELDAIGRHNVDSGVKVRRR